MSAMPIVMGTTIKGEAMKSKERGLQERLDACVREKEELKQTTKRAIVEMEEKMRLIESRNLSLKKYSSGLQEERDSLQEERDELRKERDELMQRIEALKDKRVER